MSRVVIAGSSGLIGSALVASLRADGIEAIRLVRRPQERADELSWRPGERLDPAALDGAVAVVNLCGASIGKLPWTRGYRATLVNSRLAPTRTLAAAVRELGADAPLFVSASAVGVYGDRPGEALDESSAPGNTFLAGLCVEWERAAHEAGQEARVAILRTASLLHRAGVLKPLILLTKLGVSGPLGSGRQIWPWISLADEVAAIRHIIARGITGPVNLVAPEAASANEIGRGLASRMQRPFRIPAPRFALRLGLGRDAADSLLLADARVAPGVLGESGFAFSLPTLDAALDAALDTDLDTP